MLTRRRFSVVCGLGLLGGAIASRRGILRAEENDDALHRALAEIESKLDGRLGVAVTDTQTGRQWRHRADERFPLCSTFKLLAAAAVLARVDRGQDDLSRRVRFASDEIVPYSPVTQSRVGGEGMTLAELCAAAMTQSDNTAGNLLLKSLGGPAGVTDFARTLGDSATRLDRWETALNEATPGDARDTTTPAAMAADLHALLADEKILSPRAREQLTEWLVANRTGDARLRAGLPKDWRVGDKTGSGDHGPTKIAPADRIRPATAVASRVWISRCSAA